MDPTLSRTFCAEPPQAASCRPSASARVAPLTILRYSERYLFEGARVLEVGASALCCGPDLEHRGYAVTQAPYARSAAGPLAHLADDAYDLTLLLEPLCIPATPRERLSLLAQALRVTRSGGVIFAGYRMADAAVLDHGFRQGRITQLAHAGRPTEESFCDLSRRWEAAGLCRLEDIDALRSCFAVEHLHQFAADGHAGHMAAALDALPEEGFALFLRYHFSTCERPGLLEASHHVVDVFRKL